MAFVLVVIASFVVFEVMALLFAKNTRDGEDWVKHDEGSHLWVHS